MTVRARWLEIAATLRDELPGRWSLRGGGQKTMIVGEPVEWAIPWFGFSKGSIGRLHCGVAPAMEPLLEWRMGRYGFDMSEVRSGPRSIDLLADDALDVARGFVFGPGIARIELLTPDYYGERAEQEAADQAAEGGWVLMAPGWRVINDSGSPVDVAARCIAWVQQRFAHDPAYVALHADFFRQLIDAWNDGGRDAALTFLVEHRDAQLREQKLDVAR